MPPAEKEKSPAGPGSKSLGITGGPWGEGPEESQRELWVQTCQQQCAVSAGASDGQVPAMLRRTVPASGDNELQPDDPPPRPSSLITAATYTTTPGPALESVNCEAGDLQRLSGFSAGVGAPADFSEHREIRTESCAHRAVVDGVAQFIERASEFLAAGIPPLEIEWRFEPPSTVREVPPLTEFKFPSRHAVLLKPALVRLILDAACHASEDRYAVFYELVWKVVHEWRVQLHDQPLLADVKRLRHGVRRELYRLRASASVREIAVAGETVRTVGCDAYHLVEEHLARTLHKSKPSRWVLLGPHATVMSAPGMLMAGPPVLVFADCGYTAYWNSAHWTAAVFQAVQMFGNPP